MYIHVVISYHVAENFVIVENFSRYIFVFILLGKTKYEGCERGVATGKGFPPAAPVAAFRVLPRRHQTVKLWKTRQ